MESFARCGGLERGLMVVRTSGFCGCGAGGLRRAGVPAGRQCNASIGASMLLFCVLSVGSRN